MKMYTNVLHFQPLFKNMAHSLRASTVISFFNGSLEYCNQEKSLIAVFFELLKLQGSIEEADSSSQAKKGGVAFTIDMNAPDSVKQEEEEKSKQILVSHFADFLFEVLGSVFTVETNNRNEESVFFLRKEIQS